MIHPKVYGKLDQNQDSGQVLCLSQVVTKFDLLLPTGHCKLSGPAFRFLKKRTGSSGQNQHPIKKHKVTSTACLQTFLLPHGHLVPTLLAPERQSIQLAKPADLGWEHTSS